MRYADVMSTIAVVIALGGGTAYAVTAIQDNSVRSRHVVNSSLTGTDIAPATITGSDVKSGSLDASDVLGGLPGVTYFKFSDKTVPLVNTGFTTLLTDTVEKGDYLITAEVIADAATGSDVDMTCRVRIGTGANERAVAFADDSRRIPAASGAEFPPSITVSMSGVYPVGDVRDLRTECFAFTNGATPVTIRNSRMIATELRDLQIEAQQ